MHGLPSEMGERVPELAGLVLDSCLGLKNEEVIKVGASISFAAYNRG